MRVPKPRGQMASLAPGEGRHVRKLYVLLFGLSLTFAEAQEGRTRAGFCAFAVHQEIREIKC